MLMPLAAFRKLNEERERQGLATFANPRNFTAGTVRQLEPSITAQRRMDFFAYMLLKDGQTYFDRQSKAMDALELVGFKVNPNRKLAKNLGEVWKFIQSWEAKRESLPYEIDGIVSQGGPDGVAARVGLHRKGSAMGDCIQVCGAGSGDADRKYRAPSWPHRKADAGGLAEAGSNWWNDGLARDAAQHG